MAADGAGRRPLIVLARSARALAQAACAAGFAPRVIDLFGDLDTRACAARYVRVEAAGDFRFHDAALLAAVRRLAARETPPLIWGGGLEGSPALLAALGEHCEVLGTPARALDAILSPEERYRRLRALGIATPRIATATVPATGRWLRKRRGEAGGLHVRFASSGSSLAAAEYAQSFVRGRSMSVAFLAGPARVQVLGYSAHLFASAGSTPFAWAGAIGGIELPRRICRDIEAAMPALVEAFELRGQCGVDFVLDGKGNWWVVEINPRPTATMELLVAPGAAIRAHLGACRRGDWRDLRPRTRPRASTVLYLSDPIRVAKSLDWPAWVADRPGPGARLPRGAPLCSVMATGATADAALRALHQRLTHLGHLLGGSFPLPAPRQPHA